MVFALVGLAELGIAALIVYRPTRVIGGAAVAIFMVGALILNLGFGVDSLPDGVEDQTGAWPANLVLAILGAAIAFLGLQQSSDHGTAGTTAATQVS